MNYADWVYLIFLSIVITVSYFPIRLLFHYFFHGSKPPALNKRWFVSCLITFLLSLAVYIISSKISDQEIGNRIVHAFGGGFLAYLVCFFAAKDDRIKIDKLKFFIFSFMLVMTLGIGNEVVEYFLQNHFDFSAAPHVNDTWLDLMSNITGALIAAICFTPFLPKK